MATSFDSAAIASAALSISLGILEGLVEKGLLQREEALALISTLAQSKDTKAVLFDSDVEAEASELLHGLHERLSERL